MTTTSLTMGAQANELEQLNTRSDGSTRFQCMASVVFHLRKGDYDRARRIYQWDSDKLASYGQDILQAFDEYFQ